MSLMSGLKRWSSSNPVAGCALGSLVAIGVFWVIPFSLVYSWVGVGLSWLGDAIGWTLASIRAHAKGYFSVLGFLVLFVTCLTNRDKPVGRFSNKVVGNVCGCLWLLLMFSSLALFMYVLTHPSLSTALNTLNERLEYRTQPFGAGECSDTRGIKFSAVMLHQAQSPAGPKVWTCSYDERGGVVVKERLLSEVDLNWLACNTRNCSRFGSWNILYDGASSSIVAELSDASRSECTFAVRGAGDDYRSGLLVNGKPGDLSLCRETGNRVKVSYTSDWLRSKS